MANEPTRHTINDLDVPLDVLLENLRACQPGSALAEQRHLLDAPLDYTAPVPQVGGAA